MIVKMKEEDKVLEIRNQFISMIKINPNIKSIEETLSKYFDIFSTIPGFDISFFIRNIQTLKTYQTDRLTKFKSEGGYVARNNTIYYKNNNLDEIICHESIHVATTYSEDRSGFQIKGSNGKFLGTALNEGMVEYLRRKYFEKGPTVSQNPYKLETLLVFQLCEVLGEETLVKYFSTANLLGLINEVKQTLGPECSNYLQVILNNSDELLYIKLNSEPTDDVIAKRASLIMENQELILRIAAKKAEKLSKSNHKKEGTQMLQRLSSLFFKKPNMNTILNNKFSRTVSQLSEEQLEAFGKRIAYVINEVPEI